MWRSFIVGLLCASALADTDVDSETVLSVEEIVRKYGYPFETFSNVSTEDGYLLDTYRIPHGRINENKTRPAVLIVHGLIGTARNWISLGPKKGIAFLLADNGYDVWMANVRGTSASRKHSRLNPDVDRSFWDFSWHEIGYYDLPAIIGLVRNVTNYEKISYIGHSQGATSFLVMASMRPEYNKYITVAMLLAPQAYMRHIFSPAIRFTSALLPLGESLLDVTGLHEFPSKRIFDTTNTIVQTICTLRSFQEICAYFFFGTGYNPDQLDRRDLPRFVAGFPSVAARQAFHYAQSINSGKFRQYDFGRDVNRQKYGSFEPPSYNLSRVTSPLALYYSQGDWIVGSEDVRRLCREVSKCEYVYKIPLRRFNHFDYYYAKDVVHLLYNDVIKTLGKFNVNCNVIGAC